MQVIAFSTPRRPDWRWRIVNYAGEMVEESDKTFSSVSIAVAAGRLRMQERGDEDRSVRNPGLHWSTARLRDR